MKILKILGGVLAVVLVVAVAGYFWMSAQLEPDVAVGAPSPDITLTTLEGEPLALSSLRGKVVLLDFWGTT